MEVLRALIVAHRELVPGHYRIIVEAPAVAAAASPGQFLHVRCGNTLDPLLRRPLSINAVDRAGGRVFLLYRVAGRGTALLSQKKAGEMLDVLGPLGRGFSLPPGGGSGEPVFVVAGGIGMAPLFFLLQELFGRGIAADVFYGAASKEGLVLAREIEDMGHRLYVATNDGSAGFGGQVTQLFASHLASDPPRRGARLYGCGPRPMLRELCRLSSLYGLSGEISWEERMGCGVGACLACACKTKDGVGGVTYRRTCVEGPVFAAGEVIWE